MKSLLTSCICELKNDLIREFKQSLDDTEKRITDRLDFHDTELNALKSRVSRLENSAPDIPVADKEALLAEIEDRRICSSNVIVFDMPKASKNKNDLDSTNAIFAKFADFPWPHLPVESANLSIKNPLL